jgi:S1 RNA binding domain protein
MPLNVGSVVEGKVKSIAPFGAFVEFGEKSVGLVHISEVATEYVQNINEHLKVGQDVKVMILSEEKGKINLSIKKVIEQERKKSKRPDDVEWGKPKPAKMSFEDMLSKFKQESDEKISTLKTGKETRRSRGGNNNVVPF